ncbi:uncharacterized protein H6S33_004708 [Morchella sextelata]|uniref:uncharacterized protein n=1 Tax=Morchella sextelata TaxID=1174677 RepID=UPI001D04406B|nr:uncharacterized protein H6S33_004708 [Morchella sextelata]KAH0605486.1 hypothetical protein H6S33_004708 [Morchella sextelata]
MGTEVQRFPEESPYGKYLVKDLGIFYAISMTAGLARVGIRCFINRKIQLEEVLMIGCMLFYTAYMLCVAVYLEKGTNLMNTAEDFIMLINHDERLRVIGSKASLASWYLYCICIWGCKCTWWCVLRQFAVTNGKRSLTVILAGWFLLATFLAAMITISAICTPFTDYWKINPLPAVRECHDTYRTMLIVGSLNIASDIPLLVTPIPFVMKLRAPIRRKVGLYFLFGLGLLVIGAAFGRMAEVTSLRCLGSSTFWALVETTCAFVIANTPGIASLFKHRQRQKQLRQDAERRKLFQAAHTADPFQMGRPPPNTLESPYRRHHRLSDHSLLYSDSASEEETAPTTEANKIKDLTSVTIISAGVETGESSEDTDDSSTGTADGTSQHSSGSSAVNTAIDYGSIYYPDSLETGQESEGHSLQDDMSAESDLGQLLRNSADLEQGHVHAI